MSSWSRGEVSRRELLRWGLVTAGGALALTSGLSPFARSAWADGPTGFPRSPLPRGNDFNQPMPRLDVLPRRPVASLSPPPTRESNQTFNAAKGIGPIEGRPPGPAWAHQRWEEFHPRVAIEVSQRPVGPGYHVHPALPVIRPEKAWCFEGTLPPKLVLARYGEPMLFRHHNRLPQSPGDNGGFGRNTLSTHLHNGHTPAESDGYPGAFFFPGQFYDYRWPHALAGTDTINVDATDPRAAAPDDSGGTYRIRGDWRETQSTLWFHDHMLDFTAPNVYKGNAAMLNLYSALDRGNEAIHDGVNLRLPSGTERSWGNLDYDVNLLLADKECDAAGQPFFDIFALDGFVGDLMTLNGAYRPYLEVERRKYRFRILNACVSRFLKLCLSDGSAFQLIATDGNLLERPLTVRQLDHLGVAERFDVVIDFSRWRRGEKVWLTNLDEHRDGKRVAEVRTVGEALAGTSDPCVGRVLELRVVADPPRSDVSQVPSTLVPLPERTPVVRERTFEFARSGGSDKAPWTIRVNGGPGLGMDQTRISAAPRPGTAELWHLVNGGGGWDHPVHIHFEEGQTVARVPGGVPDHERLGRKDVWRLLPGGRVSVYLRFREFSGTFVEHCHNTIHEDRAMLLRWDLNGGPTRLRAPVPTPAGVTFVDSEELEG